MEQNNKGYKYKLCTNCFTYNHAPYIVDAMNGFTMQETNFPFVCTIVDDASTDGGQEVIRNYFEENFDLHDKSIVRNEETDDYVLCFARHKTNLNCYFAVLFLKYNHYSIKKSKLPYISEWNAIVKYIAICEGDDYWINSKKLQLQVDVLEKHNNYSICICGYIKKMKDENLTITTDTGFAFDNNYHISHKMPIQPVTWMFRASMNPQKELLKYKNKYDIVQLYLTLEKGKGYYIPDVCCVYRYTGGGIFSGLNKIEQVKQALNPRIELCKYHPKDKALKKRCIHFYSLYIFNSILCGQSYSHISFEDLGLRWQTYAYLLVLYLFFKKCVKYAFGR